MKTYNPFNLELIRTPLYKGIFPIHTQQGPLVKGYVDTSFDLLKDVVESQARTFVVLVNFSFPSHWSLERRLSRRFYTLMIEAFKAQLKAFDGSARENGAYRNNTLKYLRAVEVGYQNGGLHAHYAFLFNGHVFNTLGDPNSGLINMRYRLQQAWASALKEELRRDGLLGVPKNVKGLVYFAGEHMIKNYKFSEKKEIKENKGFKDAFEHIAYLCKLATKNYYLPIQPFMPSRF